MERTCIALIHKDLDSDYGVSFPDLPGCITVGSTLEEAHVMAREALALHLEGLGADGEVIPPPGSADQALAHEDAFDAIALIVVEALPERTEEEAQAEFDAFMASECGQAYMRETASRSRPASISEVASHPDS